MENETNTSEVEEYPSPVTGSVGVLDWACEHDPDGGRSPSWARACRSRAARFTGYDGEPFADEIGDVFRCPEHAAFLFPDRPRPHEFTVLVEAELKADEELAFFPDLPVGTEYRFIDQGKFGMLALAGHRPSMVVVVRKTAAPMVSISADLALRLCSDAFHTDAMTTAEERAAVRNLIFSTKGETWK